ncbi:MAG: tRNA uracil 4-sulfurtransferase ThiI [Ignisphaera sp.]|uniref:Probable tRNA sulfurtransferase n=1 Tax=Ignisphaera aggregans TaxID=334771 RepID=A0A7C4JKC1_9CREN
MDLAILVRYGEIALKGQVVRSRMEQCLANSIEWRLRRIGLEEFYVSRERGRIFVKIPWVKDLNKLSFYAKELTKTFGVVSISPTVEVDNNIETIMFVSTELARNVVSRKNVKTFAVRARRVESYPITSKEIKKIVGQKIKDSLNLSVNLENPDFEIFIEVREKKAYIFTDIIEGPGGLPYGVEGLCIALFSGGMDSALALWLMARRGCEVLPLHMVFRPYYSEEAYQRVFNVMKFLREWIPRNKVEVLFVENYPELMNEVVEVVPAKLRCLACKKLMLLIADKIAIERKAKAIVTGDSLGQVASQTLDNIYVISKDIKVPVLRPLIAMDKQEITNTINKLGLFDVVAKNVGKCRLLPQHPETHAKPDTLDPYIDILRKLVDKAFISSVFID